VFQQQQKNKQAYRIFFPIANTSVDQIIQQPIHRLVVVEHLKKCDKPWQLGGFEHFACGILEEEIIKLGIKHDLVDFFV
jgi:hypothetical protein